MVQRIANRELSNPESTRRKLHACVGEPKTMIAEATSPLIIAENYINAWSRKDIDAIADLVHPQIRLKSPMAESTGKEAFLEAVKKALEPLEKVNIRAKFASDAQAILVYDFQMKGAGLVRNANLLTIEDGLIRSVELFFDASPFKKS